MTDDTTRTEPPRPGLLRGIIGPPVAALRRLIKAVGGWLAQRMARALEFWRRLFAGPESEEGGDLSAPTKAAPLLATALVAVVLYSWPLQDMLPWWLFIPIALVSGLVALLAVQGMSLRGSGSRFETWLRSTERRVGLVGWERLGLVVAVVATIASLFQPTLLPLTLGAVLGFGLLLGQETETRELVSVPPVPTLPPPEPDESDDTDEFVTRTLDWTVRHALGADTHQATVLVHVPTYALMKAANPGRDWVDGVPQVNRYVVDGSTREVDRLAARLKDISTAARYSTYAQVSSVLAMVQSLDYSFDQDSVGQEDYWRYPIETLHDETGDCEDTTFLAAAVLRRLGHEVGILFLPEHAALGVEVPEAIPGHFVQHKGRRYYYCETTANGWRVGELPPDMVGVAVDVYPVPAYRAGESD